MISCARDFSAPVNSSNACKLQRVPMISAETMFYFSASIRVGRKVALVLKQRNRIPIAFASRLKAPGAVSGKTLTITVSLGLSASEISL